jgi:hypothetical protein
MLFDPKLILSALFLSLQFGDGFGLVVDAKAPRRARVGSNYRRQAVAEQDLDISGLGVLTTYVCPRASPLAIRQESGSTVAIPASELQRLYQELNSIATQAIGPAIGSRKRIALLQTVDISGLDVVKRYVCPPISGVAARQDPSSDMIAIPADELEEFWTEVNAILARIAALLATVGISTSSLVDASTLARTLVRPDPQDTGAAKAMDEANITTVPASLPSSIVTESSNPQVGAVPTLGPVDAGTSSASLPNVPETQSLDTSVTSTSTGISTTLGSNGGVCSRTTTVGETITVNGTTLTAFATATTETSPGTGPSPDMNGDPEISTPVSSLVSSSTSAGYLNSITGNSMATSDTPDPAGIADLDQASNISSSEGAFSNETSTTVVFGGSAVGSVAAASTTDSISSSLSPTSVDAVSTVNSFDSSATPTTGADATSSSISGSISNLNSTPSVITAASASSATALTPSLSSSAAVPYGSTSASNYTFNSQSAQNVAVYFGQSRATSTEPLNTLCANPSIDIVILAFVIDRDYSISANSGPYPWINFGTACGAQSTIQEQVAPGLLQCVQLASFIRDCQSTYGKKVMLSVGGASSQISFPTASDASEFATILWQLFGPPGSVSDDLRPFGNVTLDGFDVGKSICIQHQEKLAKF